MSRVPLSPQNQSLLVNALGVVLVFTAVFAPMGAVVPTYSYEVIEVSPDSHRVGYLVGNSDEVLTCIDDDTECQAVSRVREDGPEVVDHEEANSAEMRGFGGHYDVVHYPSDGQFYRPHHEHLDNGSVQLRLDLISNRTAMDIAARNARTFPPEFQQLFESETVRTSDPVAGWMYWQETRELVKHEDKFYEPGGWSYYGTNSGWDERLRALAAFAGIGLLLYGRTMHLRARGGFQTNPSSSDAADNGHDRINCPSCGARNAVTSEECYYCEELL